MSVREIAYGIIDNMTEEQVSGFIAMFSEYAETQTEADDAEDALDDLFSLIKPCPNIGDYKEERHKYLDERYGS